MAVIVKKPSLSETLKALPLGKWEEFKPSQFKPNSIRVAASKLQKQGYLFECSDRGMVTGIKVKRIK